MIQEINNFIDHCAGGFVREGYHHRLRVEEDADDGDFDPVKSFNKAKREAKLLEQRSHVRLISGHGFGLAFWPSWVNSIVRPEKSAPKTSSI